MHMQDDVNTHILRMLEDTFSLGTTQMIHAVRKGIFLTNSYGTDPDQPTCVGGLVKGKYFMIGLGLLSPVLHKNTCWYSLEVSQ